MALNKNKLLTEAKKRAEQKNTFSLSDACFDKQLQFITSPVKRKVAVTSRRSGKSSACARDLLFEAMHQKGDVLYVTLSRVTAKRIIWRELLKLNEKYKIGAVADNQALELTLPNGNVIYISGAKDAAEIEKFRGLALRKVYIDEAQSFRSYIKEFVDDVLEPCLFDYDGTLILIGTPGPVKAGYFYESSINAEWGQFHWTMHDNPYIREKSGKDPEDMIEVICKRRGVLKSDPSIQREFYGVWADDLESLVYKFNPIKNVYIQPENDLTYIFGIDIGWNDSDAIAVVGYSQKTQTCYLVEEYVKSKQTISELVEVIEQLKTKYDPVKMVMDAGALGKKIQEEIRQRHVLNLEAADKHRKQEFIALLNDDLRTAKFKAFSGSIFQEDCTLVQWDYSNPEKPQISDVYHTDIGDAVLYAWRECKHFFKDSPIIKADLFSAAWALEMEEKLCQDMENERNRSEIDPLYDLNSDID